MNYLAKIIEDVCTEFLKISILNLTKFFGDMHGSCQTQMGNSCDISRDVFDNHGQHGDD